MKKKRPKTAAGRRKTVDKEKLCACCRKRPRVVVRQLGHWKRMKVCKVCREKLRKAGGKSSHRPRHKLTTSRGRANLRYKAPRKIIEDWKKTVVCAPVAPVDVCPDCNGSGYVKTTPHVADALGETRCTRCTGTGRRMKSLSEQWAEREKSRKLSVVRGQLSDGKRIVGASEKDGGYGTK